MSSDGQPTKTIVRLKHALPADAVIEVVLPDSPAEVEAMFAERDERG